VDINLSAIPGNPEWLKQKFDLPQDSIICTAVGRLVPVKGYDVLVSAMQKVASQAPQLFCLIVGEGEAKEDLTAQIRQTGLEGRVRLLGYYDRENAMSILKSSDIFVMPSRYEGTPIALLEAAALARPILASDTGGIPELVQHGDHAFLVPPGDPSALAQGLLKLALDREYAGILGQNAQQRVHKQFNLESQLNATWQAYQKALEKHYLQEK
jgi:glycosyltransferase involved in cell wall biosynthesis